jgi:hypothetical protein
MYELGKTIQRKHRAARGMRSGDSSDPASRLALALSFGLRGVTGSAVRCLAVRLAKGTKCGRPTAMEGIDAPSIQEPAPFLIGGSQ